MPDVERAAGYVEKKSGCILLPHRFAKQADDEEGCHEDQQYSDAEDVAAAKAERPAELEEEPDAECAAASEEETSIEQADVDEVRHTAQRDGNAKDVANSMFVSCLE